VFGNVLFGLKLKPNLSKKNRHDVAKYYLELVGLSRFEHANIHELSGGMKQRVSLARALAPNPRVLLMDEPFAALDALTREQLYGDIQQIWKARRKTIVFVTHNVREAACLGDRVLLFSPHPGRIREEFPVELPRPRDINSVDLAAHATQITKALKSLGKAEVTVARRMAPWRLACKRCPASAGSRLRSYGSVKQRRPCSSWLSWERSGRWSSQPTPAYATFRQFTAAPR